MFYFCLVCAICGIALLSLLVRDTWSPRLYKLVALWTQADLLIRQIIRVLLASPLGLVTLRIYTPNKGPYYNIC